MQAKTVLRQIVFSYTKFRHLLTLQIYRVYKRNPLNDVASFANRCFAFVQICFVFVQTLCNSLVMSVLHHKFALEKNHESTVPFKMKKLI